MLHLAKKKKKLFCNKNAEELELLFVYKFFFCLLTIDASCFERRAIQWRQHSTSAGVGSLAKAERTRLFMPAG